MLRLYHHSHCALILTSQGDLGDGCQCTSAVSVQLLSSSVRFSAPELFFRRVGLYFLVHGLVGTRQSPPGGELPNLIIHEVLKWPPWLPQCRLLQPTGCRVQGAGCRVIRGEDEWGPAAGLLLTSKSSEVSQQLGIWYKHPWLPLHGIQLT